MEMLIQWTMCPHLTRQPAHLWTPCATFSANYTRHGTLRLLGAQVLQMEGGFVFKSPSFSHFILMFVIWCRFPALPWSNSLYKCASSGLPKEINHLQPRCHHSSLTGGTEQKQDTSQLFKDALWPSWCKNPKQFHKDVNCNLITATEIHLPVLLY